MTEAEIKAVRDRLDIAEVMSRYAAAIDTRNPDLLRSCFAEEVEIQATSSGRLSEMFDKVGFSAGTKKRSDDWITEFVQSMNLLAVTQHVITNHMIELGADEAVCTSYLRAMHFDGTRFPGSPPYEVGGYYRHTMVRTPAGWRIRKWTLTVTWETGAARVLLK